MQAPVNLRPNLDSCAILSLTKLATINCGDETPEKGFHFYGTSTTCLI